MNDISFDNFIGRKLIEVNGKNLVLTFEGNIYLAIECFWRLRDNKTLFITSKEFDSEKTHKQVYKKLLKILKKVEIKDVRFITPVSDLIIEFTNGLYLELYNDSNIYESWTLSDNDKFLLVSLPGGEYCISD